MNRTSDQGFPLASPLILMAVSRLAQDVQNYVELSMLMGTLINRYPIRLITLKSQEIYIMIC